MTSSSTCSSSLLSFACSSTYFVHESFWSSNWDNKSHIHVWRAFLEQLTSNHEKQWKLMSTREKLGLTGWPNICSGQIISAPMSFESFTWHHIHKEFICWVFHQFTKLWQPQRKRRVQKCRLFTMRTHKWPSNMPYTTGRRNLILLFLFILTFGSDSSTPLAGVRTMDQAIKRT